MSRNGPAQIFAGFFIRRFFELPGEIQVIPTDDGDDGYDDDFVGVEQKPKPKLRAKTKIGSCSIVVQEMPA